jgi:fatty acid CoA ligase FadD9
MHTVDGTLICLVRARDDSAARSRLDSVFDSGDPDLLRRYRALAEKRLVVVAGDKSDLHLGLDEATWAWLAETVDLIIDPAALVNHMLPYPQLFDSNVVGTAELIRLALSHHQKAIAYVSSIGVGATVPVGRFTEQADIREISPSRAVDDGYANGYATSKWAGEVLLREAHDLCHLPVTVYRCDMIMAETGCRGQLNLPDMVTRLIFSLAATGLAPDSFFRLRADGTRARSHFDGLPVDFVAEAISTLALGHEGFQTYHVVNPHDDGIGLDEYVDWIADAGSRIERIADYEEWFHRFGSALRNLPGRQRQASLLPMIEIYACPQLAAEGAFAPAEHFEKAVQRAGLGVDGSIPHITSAIIAKYLSDLSLLGLLGNENSHRI